MSTAWKSALAALGLGLGFVVAFGLFGDGPYGALRGGALEGRLAPPGAQPDWARLGAHEAIEVQVGGDDGATTHSVMACLLLHDGRPYLSVTLLPLKRWHRAALRMGHVTLRQDGTLFPRSVALVEDPSLHAALKETAWRKYQSYEFGDGWAGRHLLFLRLGPPAG